MLEGGQDEKVTELQVELEKHRNAEVRRTSGAADGCRCSIFCPGDGTGSGESDGRCGENNGSGDSNNDDYEVKTGVMTEVAPAPSRALRATTITQRPLKKPRQALETTQALSVADGYITSSTDDSESNYESVRSGTPQYMHIPPR